MTMILTCLTKDYIVQASDRRLTRAVGKKAWVEEDQSNKALIYSSCFVFSYTGLAKLPLTSAIDWAAQQLSEKENIGDAVLHLGNRASDLMNSDRIRNVIARSPAHVKKLAFVGAGFAILEKDVRLNRRPLRIVISNFRGEDGTWLPQPRNVFRVDFDWLPESRDVEFLVAGQSLTKEIEFTRLLKRCVQHKVKPETIGVLLTCKIQEIAEKNPYVGKNIMCTFVPRAFGDSVRYHFGGMLLNNPVVSDKPQCIEPVENIPVQERIVIIPPFDNPRFVYIAGDNKAFPYHGPVYVVPGQVIPEITLSESSITIPPVVRVSDTQVDTSL